MAALSELPAAPHSPAMQSCPVWGLGNEVAGGGWQSRDPGEAGLARLQDEPTFPGPAEHQFLPPSGPAANANMRSLVFRALAVETGVRT